jgi:hypothetical protein
VGEEGAGTGDNSQCDAGLAGIPACTNGAPGTRAVRSSSSRRKSKAEDAMGVVDMLAKGKEDSSKMTWREIRMWFD